MAVPITTFRPEGAAYAEFYEQSSDNIWSSICTATKGALAQAKVRGRAWRGGAS
jgi:hypothetical protein